MSGEKKVLKDAESKSVRPLFHCRQKVGEEDDIVELSLVSATTEAAMAATAASSGRGDSDSAGTSYGKTSCGDRGAKTSRGGSGANTSRGMASRTS